MSIHPDDERLSAAFDGQEDLGDHAQCPECVARLDALGEVAARIAEPVTGETPDTATAVSAALASTSAGFGNQHNVLPLVRRRPPVWLAAAAVAAVVVLVAIPLMRSRSADDATTTLADA